MIDLALFPLSTVLFPGVPLGLHIFEERYKQMINMCIQMQRPFGVVLIQEGVEALGPLPEPQTVGCTAQIVQVQPLGEDRMHILAVGQERFRVHALHYDRPYLTGLVEPYPLDVEPLQSVDVAASQLRPWVERYLRLWESVSTEELDAWDLPGDPVAYAYMASYLLQVTPQEKQKLLAAVRATALIRHLRVLYRREVTVMESILERQPEDSEEWPFSVN